MTVTFVAFGPLGPDSASYDTLAPSARVLNPEPLMPVWWTNRSLPPSSGVMKPKPFSSLNHFTVPVGMSYLRGSCELRSRSTAKGDTCGAEHFVAGPSIGPRSYRAEA